MKRMMNVRLAAVGMGIPMMLAVVPGCASEEEDADSGNGAISFDKPQDAADKLDPSIPLGRHKLGDPMLTFDLNGHNTLNIADEVKKAFGTAELATPDGSAKVSIDPSSVITIQQVGFGGEIEFLKNSAGFVSLGFLGVSLGAKAEVKMKVNAEFAKSFSASKTKDFRKEISSTPHTFQIPASGGRTLNLQTTLKTALSVGCDLEASASGKASLGGDLTVNAMGGINYDHMPNGPKANASFLDRFSVQATPLDQLVTLKPVDMADGKQSYFAADGEVNARASCWARPEFELVVLNVAGVAVGAAGVLEAKAGAKMDATEVGAMANADWAVTRRLEISMWGTAGIGTGPEIKTAEHLLGDPKKSEKVIASGTFSGEVKFADLQ